MERRKMFNCLACDAEMEIAEPEENQQVTCRQCGGVHRLGYDTRDQVWQLQLEQPVEEETSHRPEDEPFSALGEVGRPKRTDRSEAAREQTDVHPGDEAVEPGRKRNS